VIDVTIHSTGTGTCSLSGKEGPGLTVTFKDGTVTNAFLSWKAFQQLLGMKAGQKKADAKPAQAVPIGNAVPAVK
jgi:hypothetical protein